MKEVLTFIFILVITFLPWVYLRIKNWYLRKYRPDPRVVQYEEKKRKTTQKEKYKEK